MTNAVLELDNTIPIDRVIAAAQSFLDVAGWELEFEDEDGAAELIVIPRDANLLVASRAFIKEDLEVLGFGDHFTAIVLIGADARAKRPVAEFGVLRLYFSMEENSSPKTAFATIRCQR